MPTSKEFVTFILDQLAGLPTVRTRAMMGEYVLYYQGKVVGGLYDNRLLVKPMPARIFLQELLKAIAAQLPAPKVKKGK